MKQSFEAAIAITEAAYDLEATDAEWFPRVLAAAVPLLDHGLGVTGLVGTQPRGDEPIIPEAVHVATGPPDFGARLMRAMSELPVDTVLPLIRPGVGVLSEVSSHEPRFLESWRRHINDAQDGIGFTAMDPNGRVVHIVAPVPNLVTLTDTDRSRWQMLSAHLCAGLRLRGVLASASSNWGSDSTGLPCEADAVLEADTLHVTEAMPSVQSPSALSAMREAAVRIDKARGRLRTEDPDKALEIWWALLRGRWSMIEWFDTDRRRYMLAIKNPPAVIDPRGLSERESQVVAYAALGENHKGIAYRLGVSRSTVTRALKRAQRKLGVRTQAELVARLHAIRDEDESTPDRALESAEGDRISHIRLQCASRGARPTRGYENQVRSVRSTENF